MQPHKIVSREEWIEARKAHMAHEKEFTKARDRLAEERRALPWVKVDKDYEFHGPDGRAKLADLFKGRPQLVVQHFMFAPDWDAGCKSCSFWADGFERMIPHLAARDTTLVAVSRAAAPLMTEGGSIVTMSYFGAEKVVPRYNVMGVAKAALEASVRYLASDLGPKGIRVNAISAGPIKTLAARGISNLGEMLKAHADRSPLRRNVDPAEVGGTAAFLLSSASSGITGETIYVDCGYNIMGF